MLLANYFFSRFNREFNRGVRGLTDRAVAAMTAHDWPGNVRELENRMKRAVIMAEGKLLDSDDLELSSTSEQGPDLDLRSARMRAERQVIQMALARSNGVLSTAAKLLGVSRPTLYGLMEVHGIEGEITKLLPDHAAADPELESKLDLG
jgi:two-component system NtrC family response regulator